jgi:hypothetical protein
MIRWVLILVGTGIVFFGLGYWLLAVLNTP